MDAKIKLSAHFFISTFVFSLLLYLVIHQAISGEQGMIIQLVFFVTMFLTIDAPLHSLLTKELYTAITKKQTKQLELNTPPTLKDIILIIAAVVIGVIFSLILITYEVSTDNLMHIIGIFGIAVIWLCHLWYAYRINAKL